MNPVKFCQDLIQNGWLIDIFVCSNWQHIWKCLSAWISPTPMSISSWYATCALTTINLWMLWSFVRIKFKIVDLLPFLFAQIDKILYVQRNIANTNDYFFRYYTHALTTILPWILWSFVRIICKMFDFSPFLFAQINKIFENSVRMNISQHQWIFFSENLHMH